MKPITSLCMLVAPLVLAAGCGSSTDNHRATSGEGSVVLEPGKTWALNPAALRLDEATLRTLTLEEETIVIPTASHEALLGNIVDGKTILISASNPDDLGKNPGFMRRVTGRTIDGPNTRLASTPVDIVDVIRGSLSTSTDRPILRTADLGKGSVNVMREGLGLKGDGTSAYSYAGYDFQAPLTVDIGKYYYEKGLPALPDSSTAAVHFEARPQLHLAPFVDFNVDVGVEWDWLNTHVELNSARVAIGLEYDARVHLEAALYEKFGATLLDQQIIPFITIATGMIGPVPFTVSLDVRLTCSAAVEAGVSLHTVTPLHVYGTPTIGAEYVKGGSWSALPSSAFNLEAPTFNLGVADNWVPPGTPSGAGIPLRTQGEFRCFVGPRLMLGTGPVNLKILGHDLTTGVFAGISAGFGESLRGAICTSFNPLDIGTPSHGFYGTTWGTAVQGSIDVRANAMASFVGRQLASSEFTIFSGLLGTPGYGGSSSCVPQ